MTMSSFFLQSDSVEIISAPNQQAWWHHMPLPDGSRIRGINEDIDYQFKMWNALQISTQGGLCGKSVLDIGANDGFFTIAAFAAGADKVTAINSPAWSTFPSNLQFASEAWKVNPNIITSEFEQYQFNKSFDVIFFFGVLYHLEDVFGCMRRLKELLAEDGVLYIETQMSSIKSDLPIFEYASDIYPTRVDQHKKELYSKGLSNYLLPNDHAINNLAYSYDFSCECLSGPHNSYSQEHPDRQFYKLRHSR